MKKFFTLIAVAAMAFGAQAETLTVSDGLYYSGGQPLLGTYCDTQGTMVQNVYPASMLAGMEGKQITEITFYTLNDYYANQGETSTDPSDFINFEGATIELSLMEIDQFGGYADENPEAVVGATVVAQLVPEKGDYIVTFVLDQPYTYTGKDLLVQTEVAVAGTWGATYFLGDAFAGGYNVGYFSYYDAYNGEYAYVSSDFLPKTTFSYDAGTTPVEPTEKTQTPDGMYQVVPGQHEVLVTITGYEGDVFYRVIYTDAAGNVTEGEWAPYVDAFSVYEDGRYRVEFYAVAQGKLPSDPGAVEFTVSPMTGIEEMNASKEVAAVRYFNMAGQEMTQPAGMTIMVTTYTDGTTSAAKVVK